MNDRYIVLNAFRPNAEVENPASFAGREFEVTSLVDALLTDGACPIIFGDRGLGKTSLALQMERIALGDMQLLQDYGVGNRALIGNQRFVTVYLACSDVIRTPRALFQGLINQAEGFTSLEEVALDTQPERREATRSIKLKFFETQTKTTHTRKSAVSYSDLTIDERLLAILEAVHEKYQRPILLIIDELDRVRDTTGLASFIKNNCGTWLRIMLVGIAQNLSALISDHQSIERKIIPVRIQRMSRKEQISIIRKTEILLSIFDIDIRFNAEATELLVRAAGGFPWFVHLFGQEALLQAWEAGELEVTTEHVELAIENLASNRFAQQFSDLYTQAVRDSPHREKVLRLFAKWGDDDIPISEIYRWAKTGNVSNPSQYKRHLTQESYGRPLVSAPSSQGGIVRFQNAMFKRYVDLRHDIFVGVKSEVEELWRQRSEG